MGLGKHECIEDDTFSIMYYDRGGHCITKVVWSSRESNSSP